MKATFYFVRSEGKESGPHSLGDLQRLFVDGQISPETRFKVRGSDNWQPLAAIYQQILDFSPSAEPPGNPHVQTIVVKSAKSRGVYIILGLLSGLWGFHNFYAGYHAKGAKQLGFSLVAAFLWAATVADGVAGGFLLFLPTVVYALGDICSVTNDADGNALA